MCTCIADIKATYTEVCRETSRVARMSFSKPVDLINKENFNIDEFLDAINLIAKDLNSVAAEIQVTLPGFFQCHTDAIRNVHTHPPSVRKHYITAGLLLSICKVNYFTYKMNFFLTSSPIRCIIRV